MQLSRKNHSKPYGGEADLGKLGDGPFVVGLDGSEDSKEHSFAGQLDSFLFQTGVDEVVDSIKRCWASAFGDALLPITCALICLLMLFAWVL